MIGGSPVGDSNGDFGTDADGEFVALEVGDESDADVVLKHASILDQVR